MELERLRLFAELVQRGSYTRTAETLGVSKGYLSKQIKQLESELGYQLIIRNTRTMRLTSAGEILYQQAQKLTSFWQDSKQLLATTEDSLTGDVVFTAPTGLLKYLLLETLIDVRRQYPDIRLIAQTGNETHNLVTASFDFAIRITNTPPEDMVAVKLAQFNYVCCATPEFLKQSGPIREPEQLKSLPCISLPYWKNWLFTQNGSTREIDTNALMQLSDNDAIKQATLASMGVSRLPSYIINNELKSGALVPLFTEIAADSREVYLLYPQTKTRPERVKRVISAIKSKLMI